MTQSCEPISAPRSNQLIVRSPDRSTKPTRFRLWLPLTPLLLLLSPLLLLALHGTRVEIQSPDASILINIF